MPFGLKSDFVRHRLNEVIDPAMIFRRLHEALEGFEKLPRLEHGTHPPIRWLAPLPTGVTIILPRITQGP